MKPILISIIIGISIVAFGVLFVPYNVDEPKQCITTPCDQFRTTSVYQEMLSTPQDEIPVGKCPGPRILVDGECVLPEIVEEDSGIHSFEECEAAGNDIMESYPRQCRTADGKHFVEIIPGKEECEIAGGLWGIWGNQYPAIAECNPSTSDGGMECSDSSQCQSFCQAKEGAQIGIEDTGMCYGYELAICLQEVRNGTVEPEWCQ